MTTRQATTLNVSPWLVAPVAIALALGAGYLSAVHSPVIAMAGVGLCLLVVTFIGVGKRLPSLFLAVVLVILTGYAFLGRGFAYLGAPPVYVGEVALGLGILSLLVVGVRTRFTAPLWIITAFIGWGLVTTVPHISTYGIDSLRDGAFWGYSLIAIAVAIVVREAHFERIISIYRAVSPIYLVWIPIALLLTLVAGSSIPFSPGSDERILVFKAGDMAVHLGGISAFILVGLYGRRAPTGGLREVALWSLWLLAFAVVATSSRGGLLAVGAGLTLLVLLRPSRRLMPLVGVVLALGSLALIINPTIETQRRSDLSVQQIIANTLSVFTDSENSQLEGTEQWRLEWWRAIIDYTVAGPYFWTGKGFGVNLGQDDGFRPPNSDTRSPHNASMTALARMGVPGFALWVAVNAAFGLSLFAAFRRATEAGDSLWAQIDVWLLVYWLTAFVNGSFDVYLEGPQGAIWFWTVIGLGFAAVRLQEHPAVTSTSRVLKKRRSGGNSGMEAA